jgi:predicted MFS family arabinose efflux permease
MAKTESPPAQSVRPNQFALLGQRRFAPFFWTQFSGAGNDNVFKFAFTVLVTYQLQVAWLPPQMAGLVIGALFILPYVLFSATSGQLADRWDKARLMRMVKNLEIAIMLLAAYGFLAADVPVLLLCTFLMGCHSTLFGPAKFAYLPQVLRDDELVGGNGMVEMGTFVAILLGNMLGGLLVALPGVGQGAAALACVLIAVAGRVAAGLIPPVAPPVIATPIRWNPFSETVANLRLGAQDPVVFRAMLAISWMWFFGAVFLSQFPAFAKDVLHGDEQVASLLLVLFSLGIGAGALLCESLGRRGGAQGQGLGLVPIGALGMSAFVVDLYLAVSGLPPSALMDGSAFVAYAAHWRVMADLLCMSLFTGLFSVPLYALIQQRSPAGFRARIIAANNILNAVFMVASALIAAALLGAGLTVPEVFLLTGLANALFCAYVFARVPLYWQALRALLRGS